MERPTCKTCPYWDFEPSDSLELFSLKALESGGMVGLCRRFPASSGFSFADEWQKSDGPPLPEAFAVNHLAQFYLVSNDDWCGEHPDFPAYIASLKEEKDASDPRKTVKQRFEPPMSRQP